MGKKNPRHASVNKQSYSSLPLLFLTLIFLGIGLIYDPGSRDPYLGPRMLWMAILGGLLFVFSYTQFQSFQINAKSSRWFILSQIIFLLWMGQSAFYAINPSESIYQLVKFTFFFCIFFLWALSVNFSLEKTFKLLSKLSVGLIFILSVIGIAQANDFAFTDIPGLPHPVGVSGNRNTFGAYMALLLPLGAYSFFYGKKSWQWMSGLGLFLGILSLFFSQTRSAWIGAGFGFVVANVLFYFKRAQLDPSTRQKLKYINLSTLAFLITGLIIVFLIAPKTTMVQELKNRLSSLVNPASEANSIASGTIAERIYVWSNSYEMSKDYPLTGVGAGNWRINFPEYGGGSSLLSDKTLMDKIRVRPHNFFLRTLTELGWIGLLIWLGLLSLLTIVGLQAFKRGSDTPSILIAVLSLTALVMFFFDLLFSFSLERMETSNLVLFYLACLLVLNEKGRKKTSKRSWSISKRTSSFIILPVFLIAAFYGYKRWQYDRNLLRIVQYDVNEQPYKMLEVVSKTKNPFITIDPVSDPIQMQEARAYIKLQDYTQAIRALEKAESYHPNNHRIHNTKAFVYLRTQELEKAYSSIQKARSLSPEYPPMLQNLCLYYFLARQYQESMNTLNKLEWKGNPSLEKLKEDIQHKIDFGAIEDSEIYQAINYIKSQVDEGKKQFDITPLISVYNKMSSDSLFITTYIETIYGGIAYAYKKKGIEERLETVLANKDQMKSVLLNAPNLTSISQRITQNDHFKTATAMQFSTQNSLQSVNKVLFQIE